MNNKPLSPLAIIYQHFSLAQWKQIAESIRANKKLTEPEKRILLVKLPSAAL